MITCNLMGGLGNQMFQIAVAYNIAKLNNDEAAFNFLECTTILQGNNSSKYMGNIFSEFKNLSEIESLSFYKEKKFSFDKITYEPNLSLIGYFQSEKYFVESKTEICKKFISGLKKEIEIFDKVKKFIKDINEKNLPIVTIHVRRGDYVGLQHIHKLCSLQYYQDSISFMVNKIGDFLPIIISDDKEWCKLVFNVGVVSPFYDELEDLVLMINSDHNIIANSTFSWWGAYLNENENKIVISPKEWFGESGHQDQDDIIPTNWNKL